MYRRGRASRIPFPILPALLLAGLAAGVPAPGGAQDAGTGEWLYTARGLGCHGASGDGGVGPSLARTGLDFDAFLGQVRDPRGIMPAFPDEVVSEAELRAIHDYVLCSEAAGQTPTPAPPRVRVGAGLGAGLLVGQGGSDFLDGGVSRWLGGTFRLDAAEHLNVHVEAGRLPLEPDDDDPTGIRAENTLDFFAVGPQVGVTLGRIRPFLAGLAGIARVGWKVEGVSTGDGERSGSESSFGLGGRLGLAVDVDRGDHPVSFLAEAHLLDPGTLGYARARSDSGATDVLTFADVTVLSLRVGVTLGF